MHDILLTGNSEELKNFLKFYQFPKTKTENNQIKQRKQKHVTFDN